MKSILDAAFHYTPSFSTDLRKTFARVRSDRQKNAERTAPDAGVTPVEVMTIIGTTSTVRY